MPYAQDVHVDQFLTTLSIAYRNDGYVGDQVLPSVPVEKRSGLYPIYGKEHLRQRDDLVRPGSVAPEWERTISRDQYICERHAQRQFVSDDERQESDQPLNPDMDTTEFLTEAVVNNREYAIVSFVTDPTVVTQTVALSGTTQWSDYTNSVPLTNLRTAKSAVRLGVFREANTFTLSYDSSLVLADHPSTKEMLKFTDPNLISSSGLPRIIRGLRVVEAGAFIDTAHDGQAATISTAFGKNALVHYTNPSPGLKTISFGYVFEAPDATSRVRGIATLRYPILERHGDMLEVSTTYGMKLVAPLGGYLFTTVY